MHSFFGWTQLSTLWYKYCIRNYQINAEYVQYCNKLINSHEYSIYTKELTAVSTQKNYT